LVGFEKRESFDNAFNDVPERPGVYVIVLKNERICRFKGESDILYIGSAKGKGGLRNRFSHYRNPYKSQTTNIKINDFIKRKPNVTIFWKIIENEDPRKEEEKLLREYLKEHDELPPLNNSNARRIRI
jgi:excinuclease UvrABC nuclease subunit